VVVHVGELHTDIRPADSTRADGEDQSGGGRTAEDLWEEVRGRSAWLAARTAATGFDD
jgi:hypothetical protein